MIFWREIFDIQKRNICDFVSFVPCVCNYEITGLTLTSEQMVCVDVLEPPRSRQTTNGCSIETLKVWESVLETFWSRKLMWRDWQPSCEWRQRRINVTGFTRNFAPSLIGSHPAWLWPSRASRLSGHTYIVLVPACMCLHSGGYRTTCSTARQRMPCTWRVHTSFFFLRRCE